MPDYDNPDYMVAASIVKNRTGCSLQRAYRCVERAEGNIPDAIDLADMAGLTIYFKPTPGRTQQQVREAWEDAMLARKKASRHTNG